ncbi:unnamed protein product [Lepeophtheirus salmonis]|uniref:(salmon louse) hypothetical protein n=1 Tax=Lepeophtheirus salmonis TaxID=72036 RepID=A0A7R8D5R6_LEPSM|nr:unnamed protein product [Lepeophtheirus salmonis]CAF3038070.1 unnamed protein product [Lepeophtheirus salmonis]
MEYSENETKISFYRNRDSDFQKNKSSIEEGIFYCNEINSAMKELCPDFKINAWCLFIDSAKTSLKALYEEDKMVKDLLNNASFVVLKTDIWYNINTTEFIQGSFSRQLHGSNIGELLNNGAMEFGNINKVVDITTDHAPNKSCRVRESELETTWIGCFAHWLNLIVDNAIDNNKELNYFRKKR